LTIKKGTTLIYKKLIEKMVTDLYKAAINVNDYAHKEKGGADVFLAA